MKRIYVVKVKVIVTNDKSNTNFFIYFTWFSNASLLFRLDDFVRVDRSILNYLAFGSCSCKIIRIKARNRIVNTISVILSNGSNTIRLFSNFFLESKSRFIWITFISNNWRSKSWNRICFMTVHVSISLVNSVS